MFASRPAVVLAVVLGLALAACGGDEDPPDSRNGADGPPPTARTAPDQASPTTTTYQVRNEDCPAGYAGLLLGTDVDAEVEYIDKIVACTDQTGRRTYLKNDSDAVWRLRNTGQTYGRVDFLNYAGAPFQYTFGGQAPLLLPEAEVAVRLPPDEVQWDIDLALSVSWQGYVQVREKFVSLGEDALLAHVKRRTPAGVAVLQCSLAVKETADAVGDLEDADFPEVVLNGLGVGVGTNKCRRAAALVAVPEEGTSRAVALSEELERLRTRTETLETIGSRLKIVAGAERALKFGLRLLHAG